jgi:hypothetical protein
MQQLLEQQISQQLREERLANEHRVRNSDSFFNLKDASAAFKAVSREKRHN